MWRTGRRSVVVIGLRDADPGDRSSAGCGSKHGASWAFAADGPPRRVRPSRGFIVEAVEPQIRALLQDWPTMPATVIAEWIGWDRSLTVPKVRGLPAIAHAAGPNLPHLSRGSVLRSLPWRVDSAAVRREDDHDVAGPYAAGRGMCGGRRGRQR